jgi:type I restriction enzyme S subunit
VKDSSVSWLGTVPKHWSVSPISYFCERLSYGFTNPMPTADDGPYLLTANDVGDGKIRYESARRTTWEAFANELTEKSKPQANDILITKDGTLGRIALYDGQEACINQSVAALKVNPSMVRPAFIALSLTGDLYQARMIYDAGGTTIKHIYISRLSKMPMAYPEINEQDQIIEYLKKIVRSSASAVADAESVVSLLQERRSALISAAVTGKIDVRNYTPKEAA